MARTGAVFTKIMLANLERYIKGESIKKLNLGSGNDKIPGAVNVDMIPDNNPDIVYDLNQFPWPFEDNSFSYVHASQIIEHLNDTIRVLEEIQRITKPDGIVYIGVPHYSSRIAIADPSHVRYFAATTFRNYLQSGCYVSKKNIRFEILEIRMTFSKLYYLLGIPVLANLLPRFYEDHFAYIFPAKFIDVLLKVKKDA
jgi:SAM-dependent methyltransferase